MAREGRGLSASTPVVVFAHIPRWAVYPDWGWVTTDGQQALGVLKRFGSVTVLNGHIHQVMQKVEGNVTLHTAMSTGAGCGYAVERQAGSAGGGRGTARLSARSNRWMGRSRTAADRRPMRATRR